MRWTERQHTLLAGLGLRLWSPRPVVDVPAAAGTGHPAREAVEPPPPAGAYLPEGSTARGVRPAGPPAVGPGLSAARQPLRGGAVARDGSPPAVVPPVAEPAPQPLTPVAGMDWPALRDAVAACQACALCHSRRQTVFGVGSPQAELMIVGEAPGEQEDAQGEPFVGAAGQLLDNMLRSVALTRHEPGPAGAPALRQVFIANTLKCRPPRNRNPDPQELARCLPFLHRQIELVRPRLLLASGKFAVKALLDSDEAIGRLRGRVHQYRGIPVIVTYHPAYLLRQLPEKAKGWEDLCLAMDTLERLPPR